MNEKYDNDKQKNMLVRSAWTGHLPSLPSLLYKNKKHQAWRLRFAGFNFGHVQLLMFVVVVIRHIHSVILIRSCKYYSFYPMSDKF